MNKKWSWFLGAAVLVAYFLLTKGAPPLAVGAGDARGDSQRRRSLRQQKVCHQNGSSEKPTPLFVHFKYTARQITTVMARSHSAGAVSGFVHSGFCVPSRISFRMSLNCFRASDSSQGLVARSA